MCAGRAAWRWSSALRPLCVFPASFADVCVTFLIAEHLGSCENYNLQNYLAIGECDGSLGPEEMYNEAMDSIFKHNQPCHRFPQLRWSKRHPGKYRWVLYEMWPLTDPVTQQKAVLVCEQNISQVKALEEQIRKQNQRYVRWSLKCSKTAYDCGTKFNARNAPCDVCGLVRPTGCLQFLSSIVFAAGS